MKEEGFPYLSLDQTHAPLTLPEPLLPPTPLPPIPPPILESPTSPKLHTPPTPFLDPLAWPSLGSPSGITIDGMLHLHNKAEDVPAPSKELHGLPLVALPSMEDQKWLWILELGLDLSSCLTPPLSPSHSPLAAINTSPLSTSAPTALNITALTATPGPLDMLSTLAQAAFVPCVEREVMWTPVTQLWPQQAYWDPLIWELEQQAEQLKLESQDYEGGNVMVTEDPTSFPISCSPSLSFEDYLAYVFPDTLADQESPY